MENLKIVRNLILEHRASAEFLRLLPFFLSDCKRIEALKSLAVSNEEYPFPQYASHILLHVARTDTALLEAYYQEITDTFLATENESVRRNLLGVLICYPLREYKEGELLERLFSLFSDPVTKPGIVNYVVRKLAQYLLRYPELTPEFDTIVTYREDTGASKGIRNWSRNVLKEEMRKNKKSAPKSSERL